jgi:hypothetical protein
MGFIIPDKKSLRLQKGTFPVSFCKWKMSGILRRLLDNPEPSMYSKSTQA